MNIKDLIAEEMCSICNKHNYDCTLEYIDCKYINERLDYILSLQTPDTHLAIVRKVGVLPENPYPRSIFPDMTANDFERLYKALKESGLTSDKVHGSWGRIVWDNCVNKHKELGFIQEATDE